MIIKFNDVEDVPHGAATFTNRDVSNSGESSSGTTNVKGEAAQTEGL